MQGELPSFFRARAEYADAQSRDGRGRIKKPAAEADDEYDPHTIQPKTLAEMFPDVDFFLHRGILCEPQMCRLSELGDGTYSLYDVHVLNQLIDLKDELKQRALKREKDNG